MCVCRILIKSYLLTYLLTNLRICSCEEKPTAWYSGSLICISCATPEFLISPLLMTPVCIISQGLFQKPVRLCVFVISTKRRLPTVSFPLSLTPPSHFLTSRLNLKKSPSQFFWLRLCKTLSLTEADDIARCIHTVATFSANCATRLIF